MISFSACFGFKASIQFLFIPMLATGTATIDELISDLDPVACFGFGAIFGKGKLR